MTTPVRRQYLQIKRQYPDTILFFRLGDFYETFDEDAKIVARVCDIALTSRPIGKGQRVPLAGVPYHSADTYIAKLLKAGYKVAICEQEGNTPIKGLVPRRVVRVVTPGTLIEPHLLPEKANNYLAALIWDERGAGLAYVDISTGEFAATEIRGEEWERRTREELARLHPAELIIPQADNFESDDAWPEWLRSLDTTISPYAIWRFDEETARTRLREHFHVQSLAGFGIEGKPLAARAAGALLAYVEDTQPSALSQLNALHTYSLDEFMTLDEATRRALELVETMREGTTRGTLLWVLDKTQTPMGARLLRRWILQPLLDVKALNTRLDMVQVWVNHTIQRMALRNALHGLGDVERWTNRIIQRAANPRDLVGLREALTRLPEIHTLLSQVLTNLPEEHPLHTLARKLDTCSDVADLLTRGLAENPPATTGHPGLIAPGYSEELDNLKRAASDAKTWIAGLEQKERERTGIKNLKVGYNKVFGYYIEVTKANTHLVPSDYVRKQTLVNAERYITPELKEYESLVLNAQERIIELETTLFREIIEHIARQGPRLLQTARALAELDVFLALAHVAVANDYTRPELAEDKIIDIKAGRHPVVELTQETPFVPNDTLLEPQAPIHILTGPNMAGKCVIGSTMVFTESGPRYIEDLQPAPAPDNTFLPLGLRVQGKKSQRLATHFYVGGHQHTIKITTHMGFILEGTPDHRVWVKTPQGEEQWRRLDELQPGDVVTLACGFDMWGNQTHLHTPRARALHPHPLPQTLDEDLAYLIGMLVKAGTLTYRDKVYLSTTDPSVAEKFTRIAGHIFGYPVEVDPNGKTYYINNRQIRLFLEELGLGYEEAHEKHVPSPILGAPRHIVVAFLQGVFDADDVTAADVHFSTLSPRLAQEIQMLLLNLGIIASVHPEKTGARMNYHLIMRGENLARFHERVNIPPERKQPQHASASHPHRYFYDRVRDVSTHEGEVYDLSVEEEHAYIANGFISHNSTYLRQVALITLMAQIGSFVPAREAHIGLVDRIFTRIGAGDEIHRGQSTFMVEMLETASILHHATNKSLVILDEVGRGTSTYDGLAIAWAIVEYIHNHPKLRCRTLFATHYHELTQLAEQLPGVLNFRVDVAEEGDKVIFLHKIVPGGADKSYGVHVAELAGMPRQVVQRARELINELENSGNPPTGTRRTRKRRREPEVIQLPLFVEDHPVIKRLRELDINQMTPLEALNTLYELQKQIDQGET